MAFVNAFHRVFIAAGLMAGLALAQELPVAGAPEPDSGLGRELPEEAVFEPVPPPAAAPTAPDATRNRRARNLRRQGNTLYNIGNASLLLGLGGLIVAGVADEPALAQPSLLAHLAGLPLLGVGSNQVYRAYRLQDPEAPGDGRAPWLWYGMGWASHTVGFAFFAAAAAQILDNVFVEDDADAGKVQTLLLTGLGFTGAGVLMHAASWYQFSGRRADANEAWSISLEPTVPINSRGVADGFGLRLKARF